MNDDLNTAVMTMDSEVEDVTEDITEEISETTDNQNDSHPSWVRPLQNIGTEILKFEEFGKYEYTFQQIIDPSGMETGRFVVYHRDLTRPNSGYDTCRGLLSGQYVIGHAEALYNELAQEVQFTGGLRVVGTPFSVICGASTTTPITLFSDDSVKYAMELVTGIDFSSINDVNSNIEIYISNTYDGTKSIHIDYVLKTIVNNGGNTREFRDYFILARNSHTFEHSTHSLGAVSADMVNVQQYYNSTIAVLKQTTVGIDDVVEKMSKLMKKEVKNQFMTYWENLPIENKNLLFALVFASHILDMHYDGKLHMNLRTYVQSVMNKLFNQE